MKTKLLALAIAVIAVGSLMYFSIKMYQAASLANDTAMRIAQFEFPAVSAINNQATVQNQIIDYLKTHPIK